MEMVILPLFHLQIHGSNIEAVRWDLALLCLISSLSDTAYYQTRNVLWHSHVFKSDLHPRIPTIILKKKPYVTSSWLTVADSSMTAACG